MKLELEKINEPITENEIQAFESNFGYKLPKEYKHFLLKHNGGRAKDNLYVFEDDLGRNSFHIDRFYKFDAEHPFFINSREPGLDNGLLVICGADHAVLLSLREQDHGKVYYYEDGYTEDEETMTLLANDFNSFMNNFEYRDDN